MRDSLLDRTTNAPGDEDRAVVSRIALRKSFHLRQSDNCSFVRPAWPPCRKAKLRRLPLSPPLPCMALAADTLGETRLYLWFGNILLHFSPFVKGEFPVFSPGSPLPARKNLIIPHKGVTKPPFCGIFKSKKLGSRGVYDGSEKPFDRQSLLPG